MNNPIYVTAPSLAPLEEYNQILAGVWERGILTHNGPLVQQFEKELITALQLKNMVAVSNGTIAIQMAIKALELKGEIITTPFTWIATVSAIQWEGCTPVFADIDAGTLNIDPKKIEKKITDKTCAILPVHVFGNPCDVEEIERIAKKHNLKVIYDAAHAVGSTYKNESLLNYGDISATSFHATKLLNTAEGGGVITANNVLHEKLRRIRFFGHDDSKWVVEEGFNGKMTEVHAALGLANLKYYQSVLEDRKSKYLYYREQLGKINSIGFQELKFGETNYSYFPVILESEDILLKVESALNKNNVFPRRYFYPSVNLYKEILPASSLPISEDISKRILCLPLYYKLTSEEIDFVISIVTKQLI